MPWLLTLDDRTNRRDASVLALQLRTIGVGLEARNQCRAKLRRRTARDEIEHTRKFDHAQRVVIHRAARPRSHRRRTRIPKFPDEARIGMRKISLAQPAIARMSILAWGARNRPLS